MRLFRKLGMPPLPPRGGVGRRTLLLGAPAHDLALAALLLLLGGLLRHAPSAPPSPPAGSRWAGSQSR